MARYMFEVTDTGEGAAAGFPLAGRAVIVVEAEDAKLASEIAANVMDTYYELGEAQECLAVVVE